MHEGSAAAEGSESENPVIDSPTPVTSRPHTIQDWWPNSLDLSVLHAHSSKGNPLGADFDYAAEFAGLDAPPNEARAQLLLGDLRAVFPQVRTEGATTWMGHRPCLPDSVPVLGPLRTWEGIWCAFGHGHLGLTGAAPTGAVIAAAMAGDKPNFDFAPFSAERF
jgi:glycine/D-amino acid oxidase-like deaminating enzyme